MVVRGLDLSGSGLVPVGVFCEHRAELFVFYNFGEILTGCLTTDLKGTALQYNWLLTLHSVTGY